MPTSSINLGSHPAWKTQSAHFTLRNDSAFPVPVLAVRKTCGCAEASVDRKSIPAGGSVDITVQVSADTLRGVYSKHVFVHLKGLSEPIRLTVNGRALTLVEIKPAAKLRIGTIRAGTMIERQFLLTPGTAITKKGVASSRAGDSGAHPGRATRDAASAIGADTEAGIAFWRLGEPRTPSGVRARLDDEEPAAKDRQCVLTVKGNVPEGRFRWVVQLPVRSPEGHPPIEIVLYGRGVPAE